MKAIYCFDSSFILACQKPDFRLRQEKCPAPTRLSISSWICERGHKSFFTHVLSQQKSMHKCTLPPFFLNNTIALHHGPWLGCIALASSISITCACTSSTIGWGICLNLPLNGSSSVTLTTCHGRSI